MKRKNISFKNLIMLTVFAAALSVGLCFAISSDNDAASVSANETFGEPITAETLAAPQESVVIDTIEYTDDELVAVDDDLSEEETSGAQKTEFTVTEYSEPLNMYTSDTVNVRQGAGTDYDRLGKLKWGTQTQVTGETDNGWYEVVYNDSTAYICGDYMVTELPGIPYVFVGDSRTVQLQNAVGSNDKAYIAKVGEGYSWFKNTALSEIHSYAGPGTSMIINFGVNDLANASKYISLINSQVDEWINAGITVYYAAVTPVGSCNNVNNAQIEAFNAKLQSELDSRIQWIDGYTYLSQTGFTTADGLHYNSATYKNLYSYYMSVIDT